MAYLYVLGGLLLLGLGGEAVVRGAVDLSARLGLSKLLIGLFVVALGTSSPELFVAIDAVLSGKNDIAVGNAIGSNIANLLLVLALAAVIHPVACDRVVVHRDVVFMLAVSGFFVWLCQRGSFGMTQGAFMVGALGLYILYAYVEERLRGASVGTLEHNLSAPELTSGPKGALGSGLDILWLVVGFVALIFGAGLLVDGASELARLFGVSEAVIAVSIVAVGTSLPEIATVVIAAMRGHPEVAIGGIIGSNIFNILAVLGVTSMVAPLTVSQIFIDFDLWVMLAAALVVVPFMVSHWRVSRLEGGILLLCYGAYVYVNYQGLSLPEF